MIQITVRVGSCYINVRTNFQFPGSGYSGGYG